MHRTTDRFWKCFEKLLQPVKEIAKRSFELLKADPRHPSEIINICTEDEFLSEGKPDIMKIRPFLLTMPDNNYRAVGENIGKAWSAGKKFRTMPK